MSEVKNSMFIEVLAFGSIGESIPSGALQVPQLPDTTALCAYLEDTYPVLAAIKYKLAVNQKLVQENMPINDGAVIAIMPPFSGG